MVQCHLIKTNKPVRGQMSDDALYILGDAHGNYVSLDPTKKPAIVVADASTLSKDDGCLKYWKRVQLEAEPSWYANRNFFGRWPVDSISPPKLFTLLHVVQGQYLQWPTGAPSYTTWPGKFVANQEDATVFISKSDVEAVIDATQSSKPGYSLYKEQLAAFPQDMAFIFNIVTDEDAANARAQLAIMAFNTTVYRVDVKQPNPGPKHGECADGTKPTIRGGQCITSYQWPAASFGTYGNGCQCPSSSSFVDADALSSTCGSIPDTKTGLGVCRCAPFAQLPGLDGEWWSVCDGGIVWGTFAAETDGRTRNPTIISPADAVYPVPSPLPATGCTIPPSILPTPPAGPGSSSLPSASAERTKKTVRIVVYAMGAVAALVFLSGLGLTIWHHMQGKAVEGVWGSYKRPFQLQQVNS